MQINLEHVLLRVSLDLHLAEPQPTQSLGPLRYLSSDEY